jgi:predicted short-subunit dehydrogenase-like oxidoreductase (DUF2520 family)
LKAPLNIVVIGAGNVAHHVTQSLQSNKTVNITQVFNHRKTTKAKALANINHFAFVSEYAKIDTTAGIYIICVKDDAIPEVVKQLIPLKLKGLVVHTSGSIDMSILKQASPHIGVYYPLQSFSYADTIDWKHTPILVEANSQKSLSLLKAIAASVSDTVKNITSEKRLQLHLAAVFASNFTNALYDSAFRIIEKNLSKKDTQLLLPLMTQAFGKLTRLSPKQSQTGPAMRHDKVVMKKHLELLKSDKQLTAVYKLLSELIVSQQTT